jgi:hypothetical protein
MIAQCGGRAVMHGRTAVHIVYVMSQQLLRLWQQPALPPPDVGVPHQHPATSGCPYVQSHGLPTLSQAYLLA